MPEKKTGLGFTDFIEASKKGEMPYDLTMTYDGWVEWQKGKKQRGIESRRYLQYWMDVLSGKAESAGGNFFDWLATQREITPEENKLRTNPNPFI